MSDRHHSPVRTLSESNMLPDTAAEQHNLQTGINEESTSPTAMDDRPPARRSARAIAMPRRFLSEESDVESDQELRPSTCADCGGQYTTPRRLHAHRRTFHGSPHRRPGRQPEQSAATNKKSDSNTATMAKSKTESYIYSAFCPNDGCERHEAADPQHPFRTMYHQQSHLWACKHRPDGQQQQQYQSGSMNTDSIEVAPRVEENNNSVSVNVFGETVPSVRTESHRVDDTNSGKDSSSGSSMTRATTTSSSLGKRNSSDDTGPAQNKRPCPNTRSSGTEDTLPEVLGEEAWRQSLLRKLEDRIRTWDEKLAAAEKEVETCKQKVFEIRAAISVVKDDS